MTALRQTSPSPLPGGGSGRGPFRAGAALSLLRLAPRAAPSPRRGEGLDAARGRARRHLEELRRGACQRRGDARRRGRLDPRRHRRERRRQVDADEILYGFYRPTRARSASTAKRSLRYAGRCDPAGIGMVHQHFMLVETFSVLENMMLGSEGGGSGEGPRQGARRARAAHARARPRRRPRRARRRAPGRRSSSASRS